MIGYYSIDGIRFFVGFFHKIYKILFILDIF